MRSLVVILLVVVALAAATILALPRLIAWEDYRQELAQWAASATGQAVAIDGRIDLNLLPQPTLSMADASLLSHPEAADRMSLEVDRLDLQLKPLPLLRGRLDVVAVRLVRPILDVKVAAGGRLDPIRIVAAGALLPLEEERPSRVSVVDGQAILRRGTLETQVIDRINLDLSARPGGPVEVEGVFGVGNQPFRLTTRVGRLTVDRSSTLRLEIAAVDGVNTAPTTLSFGGVVDWRPEAPRLRGEAAFAGDDLGAALTALATAVGHAAPDVPWGGAPFRLAGPVTIAAGRVEAPEIELRLDDIEARGRVELELGPQPELDLALEATAVALPDGAAAVDLATALAPFAALAHETRGRVNLSVGALEYRGTAIRRLRATLTLAGDGVATVEQIGAVLPGQTDVRFAGELIAARDAPELRGTLTAVSEDLRAGLAWLDLAPDRIEEGRLRTFSLTSALSLTPDTVRLGDAELRVDATRMSGKVALQLGSRPQLAAVVSLDRLNVDAYWPREVPGDPLALMTAPLARFDAALEVEADRLTWRGLRLREVRFDGRAVQGRMTIAGLRVGDLAGSELQLAGDVDLAGRSFELTGDLNDVHASRLLRRLGIQPPPLLGRLPPLAITGSAEGTADAFTLSIIGIDDHAGGTLALRGEAGWGDGGPAHYQVEIEADHPDYAALLRDLGVAAKSSGTTAAPLTIAGQIRRSAGGEGAVTGTARLGPTSFTGRVGWQPVEQRPRVAAQISVGEPTAPVLGGLLRLLGWRLELPGPAGDFEGGWSTRPLALGLLDRVDGELELTSKGGLAGSGLEVAARLEQGRLVVERLAAALWGGKLEGELWFDTRRPLPYLEATMDLRGIDPELPAAWLGLPPVFAGATDITLETSAAGDTVRKLVGSSIGTLDVSVAGADARSSPAMPPVEWHRATSVEGSFALARGIATARSVEIELGSIRSSIDGAIDLYSWAADLTVSPEIGPPLRIVGPLHRPQLRVVGQTPDEPGRATP